MDYKYWEIDEKSFANGMANSYVVDKGGTYMG